MTSVFSTFLIVIITGFLGSLFGLGGGIIMTPALTLLPHVGIWYATGVSIISVVAMSSGVAITYLKDHLTNVRVGMSFEIGITLGTITGASLSGMVDMRYLYLTFSLLTLYSAVVVLRKADSNLPHDVATHSAAECLCLNNSYYDKSLDQEVPYQAADVYDGLGMMYMASAVPGLLGIDSDVFKAMGMDLFMKLPMKVSSATSSLMVGVTAVASAGVYLFRRDISPGIATPVVLSVLMGVVAGIRVMQRMKSRVIRLVSVPVLVITFIQTIVKGVPVR